MDTTIWHFTAADTLFFGAGKPMNAGESSWIDSQFPPNGFTLQGTVRTAILFHNNADIQAFLVGNPCLENGDSLSAEIGDATSLGRLDLIGPFFQLNDKLLLPVPLDLITNTQRESTLLKPAEQPVHCDLGKIRLPVSSVSGGYKINESAYLSLPDMAKLLKGESAGIEIIPQFSGEHNAKALADKEPKIGLARDNSTRNNLESMLFAIAPVRMRPNVGLQLQVKGIHANHIPNQTFLQKLGGEGKLANIQISQQHLAMPAPQLANTGQKIRFKLVLIQPALMPVAGWLPEGFVQISKQEYHCWNGVIDDCQFDIISACIGKPIKIGGWDLQKHQSKPHQAYIPAGSVYFCEADAVDQDKVEKLHNTKLGLNTQYGFGHVLVGLW